MAASLGLCLPGVEIAASSVDYCATDLAFGQQSSNTSALIADSVLCVSVDNNEVAGEYFSKAPEEDMSVTNAFLKNPKPDSFLNVMVDTSGTDVLNSAMSSPNGAYAPGDAIRIFMKSSSSVGLAPVLTTRAVSVGSNECWDMNPVRFDLPVPFSECVVRSLSLGTECIAMDGRFSVAPLVENIYVAKHPNVTSTSNQNDLISIEIDKLSLYNATTASMVDLQTPYPSYFPIPTLVVNASTNVTTCQGSLLRMDYLVFHDGEGHIERVLANVTIGDSTATEHIDVVQQFSVRFESTYAIPASQRSLLNGNVQTYPRSGNPGYLLHHPLRVGVLASNSSTDVIAEMTGGLTLPGPSDCFAITNSFVANFGEDSQTSCSLSLTSDSFKTFCSRTSPVPNYLQVNFTHVAEFGNSEPFLVSEWLELEYEPPTKSTASFTSSSGSMELTCDDVITGTTIELLVAQVGPVLNPQNKIIAARASHSTSSWGFWNTSSTKMQSYFLHTTISYVFVQPTALAELIPPAPDVWFSIPNDVFYPFMLNRAQSVSVSLFAELLVLLVMVVNLLQIWLP